MRCTVPIIYRQELQTVLNKSFTKGTACQRVEGHLQHLLKHEIHYITSQIVNENSMSTFVDSMIGFYFQPDTLY